MSKTCSNTADVFIYLSNGEYMVSDRRAIVLSYFKVIWCYYFNTDDPHLLMFHVSEAHVTKITTL